MPPYRRVALWQTAERWLIAAHVLAEIQWVFRLPCWCNALVWWHDVVRPPIDRPYGPLFGHVAPRRLPAYGGLRDPVLGFVEWNPVSAAIHSDDEGGLDEDRVLAWVQHDPATYVEHYLRRCLASLVADGPRMLQIHRATQNPVLAIWAEARDRPAPHSSSPGEMLGREKRLAVATGQRVYRDVETWAGAPT